jgi:ribosomal-protein-alanine N-acetyltransferase
MLIAETERLILREMTAEDAEDFFRIYNDPQIKKFVVKNSISLEEVRGQIENHIENYYKKYEFGLWATVLKENNCLIGRCGLLYQEVEGVKDLEIAYLFDSDYWGNGFASEAAEMLVKLGFQRFGFKRVVAYIDPQNTASIRVAEKSGLKYEREIAQFKDFGKVSMYSLEK